MALRNFFQTIQKEANQYYIHSTFRLKHYKKNIGNMLNDKPLNQIGFLPSDFAQLSWFDSYFARNWLIYLPNKLERPLLQVYALEGDIVLQRAKKVRKLLNAKFNEKEIRDLGTQPFVKKITDEILEEIYSDQFIQDLPVIINMKREGKEKEKKAASIDVNELKRELENKKLAKLKLDQMGKEDKYRQEKLVLQQEIDSLETQLNVDASIAEIKKEFAKKISNKMQEIKSLVQPALHNYITNYLLWKRDSRNPGKASPPEYICPLTRFYNEIVNPQFRKLRPSQNSRSPQVSRNSLSTPGTPLTPITPAANVEQVELKHGSAEGPSSSNDTHGNKKRFKAANDARKKENESGADKKDSKLAGYSVPPRMTEMLMVPNPSENKDSNLSRPPSSQSVRRTSENSVQRENKSAENMDSANLNNKDKRKYPRWYQSITKNPLRWVNATANFFCEAAITISSKISTFSSKVFQTCYKAEKYCVSWFNGNDPWFIMVPKILLLGPLSLIPLAPCLAGQIICVALKVTAIATMTASVITMVATDATVNFASFTCALLRDSLRWVGSKSFIKQNPLNYLVTAPVDLVCRGIMTVAAGVVKCTYHVVNFKRNDSNLTTFVKGALFLPICLSLGTVWGAAYATKYITKKTVAATSWVGNKILSGLSYFGSKLASLKKCCSKTEVEMISPRTRLDDIPSASPRGSVQLEQVPDNSANKNVVNPGLTLNVPQETGENPIRVHSNDKHSPVLSSQAEVARRLSSSEGVAHDRKIESKDGDIITPLPKVVGKKGPGHRKNKSSIMFLNGERAVKPHASVITHRLSVAIRMGDAD